MAESVPDNTRDANRGRGKNVYILEEAAYTGEHDQAAPSTTPIATMSCRGWGSYPTGFGRNMHTSTARREKEEDEECDGKDEDSPQHIHTNEQDDPPTNLFANMLKSDFVYEVSSICKSCQAQGVVDVCIHSRDLTPPWGGANMKAITALMEAREAEWALANRVFDRPRIVLTEPVRFVYVAILPGTGSWMGRDSVFTLVSFCEPTVILGIEAFRATRSEDFEGILKAHLTSIRAMDMAKNCTFVVSVEAGTGLSAPDIETTLGRAFDNVIFVSDFEQRAGTIMSKSRKLEMMKLTMKHLRANTVDICGNFVTSHEASEQLLLEFKAQLCAFVDVVQASTEESLPLEDVCGTFMRAIFARHMFLTMKQYHIHQS